MWDSSWPYWEFSVETKGELCLRGINLFPYMGTGKKKHYPCQYFKFAVTRDWMSRGNRKEIQSLSLLGHWLKSCLFQQWPKLITIQACCSVTNSMWKELVASEAGAHCRQPQQKDQGFGWTLNLISSSTPSITSHPRCSCPRDCSLHAWTNHGLGSSPCPCLTSYTGDLCCHYRLCSAAWVGWDSALPPRSLPT